MRVKTLADAARFVEASGFAYVFPDNRVPLPSLWGAVSGNPRREMHEEDRGWTQAVERTWDFKNRLGEKRLAWFGRLLRGKGTLVAPRLLPALRAALSGAPLSPDAQRARERLRNVGAMSTLRLRESLGFYASKGRARFDRVLLELYRGLHIANVGTDDTETRWPAGVVDVFERAFPKLRPKAAAVLPAFLAAAPGLSERRAAQLLGFNKIHR